MKDKDPCWKNYQMVGMKTKNGKKVPNCVPVEEDGGMSVGGGAVAGLGSPASPANQREPGVPPRLFIRRKKFAGNEVFEVNSDMYAKCLRGKKKYAPYESYVGNDDVGHAIREYANQNKGKAIIVQDETTGMMTYLRYGNRR
jgi:hypothetical protein